jgi:hypothetical protein
LLSAGSRTAAGLSMAMGTVTECQLARATAVSAVAPYMH